MSIDNNGLIANIYQDGENTGGTTETSNTWQQYTYTFTASDINTQVSFLFRQDPAYWAFDDVSVTAPSSSTNLIVNSNFEGGAASSNGSQPASWSLIGTPGLDAAGQLTADENAHSGSYDWYDGAVGGFDGLAQTITTTPGVTYTLSFWLLSTSQLEGNQAPSTAPDESSSVEQFLVYAGSLPGGLVVTPATPPPSAPSVTTVDGTEQSIDANLIPVIAGFASSGTPAGSTVTLYVDGAEIGTTTTTDADGNWSYTVASPLAGGNHVITATETTDAGTSSQSGGYSLQIVAPPSIVGADGTGRGLDNNNLPAITGTAAGTEIGTTITVYDGATALGTALTSDAAGEWSFTPTTALTDGDHNLTATATVGETTSGASTAYSVIVDTTASPAPVSLALAPVSDSEVLGDNLTSVTAPVITGTGTAGDTVTLYDGETAVGSAPIAEDGTWSVTSSTLADGTHILTAVDIDPAGNLSEPSTSLVLTIDTTASAPPTGLALDPASDTEMVGDNLTRIDTPAITGTGTAGDTITLYDGETAVGSAMVGEDGTWSVTTTVLADGIHALSAVDTDPAGNVSGPSATLNLTIDTTPSAAPAAIALAPVSDSGLLGDNVTSVTTPDITGTGTAGDTVTLYDGETAVGSATVGEDGTWSITTTTLAEGNHSLLAVELDPAGNASLQLAPTLTIDTTPAPSPASLALAPVSDSGGTGRQPHQRHDPGHHRDRHRRRHRHPL